MTDQKIGRGTFMLGDCLERMKEIPAGSVDMILCDLPYGTTTSKNAQGVPTASWDWVIPFDLLWYEYRRVLRSKGNVVLTASQPFTAHLILSNLSWFKYCLVWEKTRVGAFMSAKYRPLTAHEDICVFTGGGVAMNSKTVATYRPQGLISIPPKKRAGRKVSSATARTVFEGRGEQIFTNWPRSVLRFDSESRGFHPTQKPVALFEYLIRTYTDENQTVLDNCAGSGTTAISAERTKRNWICIERDPDYFAKACQRVRDEVERQKADLFA